MPTIRKFTTAAFVFLVFFSIYLILQNGYNIYHNIQQLSNLSFQGFSSSRQIDQHHNQQSRPKIQNVALAKFKVTNANNKNNATTATQQGNIPDHNQDHSRNQLALEIKSIHHILDQRQIIINLQKGGRKCRNPKFFGRLSGPYVTLIEWETSTSTDDSNDDDNRSILVGTYSLPSQGRYFIEVISLFCNGPQWNASYQTLCMEDPTMHRITEDIAFIDVVNVTKTTTRTMTASSSASSTGGSYYWKWSNDNETTIPLLTRYQPQQCRSQVELQSDFCQSAVSRKRFAPYQFIGSSSNINGSDKNDDESRVQSRLMNLKQQQHTNGTTAEQQPLLLCFIGLSHAREMSSEVNLWLNKWNATSAVQSTNIDAQFPRMVNVNSLKYRRCNFSIIASGQWSAGRKPPGGRFRNIPPTTFEEYESEVRDMILRLNKSGLPNIFLRSIHYNALGDIKTICPPQDWRSPPIIDGFNDIIRNLTLTIANKNISYIDTNFIVGPLWDISEDFCHYRSDKVASAEALYMLSRLLLQ
mmetsp:Transcript_14391/g.28773  ORF Transcript_14391/g.28773 Transcript_14391/m.28773 type:complete len:527 (+) Transcript_14391:295-1875(+)|eukprot:CAMPEP_0194330994 /NCGR_PEP_ID=MMETSP0171-20130528/53976_1 /TAXON_ID=218684 /ORGANISM="Corethron pennatum, Strain L29A3" /LENGTH=526 /DNA_ID=CAMNT_0039092283 /DNA_START=202 /DNA_END=1782 /DNA_ORIENTATION=+